MQRTPAPRLRAVHTLALLAFALVQPLLELLGQNPEFMAAHQLDALDLTLIAFAVALAVPGAIALAKWGLERLAARPAAAIHLTAVALLAAAIALPVIKEGDAGETPGWVLAPGALVMGVAAAAVYARSRFGPTFLTLLSPALLLFPLLFLFTSPAGQQLGPAAASRAAAGQAPATAAISTPVVVVVFSGLPLTSLLDDSERIDRDLFPHFADLAQRSHFFRNATTVAESADYAVPAIATGLYPAWKRPPTAVEYPQSLFSLLSESHDFNVFESLTRLCPVDLCAARPIPVGRAERLSAVFPQLPLLYLHYLLPPDWTSGMGAVAGSWRRFEEPGGDDAKAWFKQLRRRYDDVPWIFSEFLARIFRGEKPTLHFLHVDLPLGPYEYLPSGTRYRSAAIHPDARRHSGADGDVEWAETQALQRHLLQVGYADTFVGRLRERLEDAGLFDSALVIVTADHGVSFAPGLRHRALHRKGKNAGDILLVPLLVKLPGQREGSVSDLNVETIDILPTVLDVLDLDTSEPLDGHSLLDASFPARAEKVVYRTPLHAEALERRRKLLDAALASRLNTVHRISQIFGRGKGRGALFDVGEYRELLGQSIGEDAIGGPSPFAVKLDDRSDYDDVDPGSGFVPAHVTGWLEAESIPDEALHLAIALNGVIRAVTRTFEHEARSARFTAMLPEQAFQRGRNRVEVLVVREDPKGVGLLSTELRPDAA